MKRISISSLMLLAALSALPWSARAPGQESGVDDSSRKDLDQLRKTLEEGVEKDEAGRRLVSRNTPEARRILAGVLGDPSNRNGQLAVARALASDPAPDPQFIVPLQSLLGSDRPLTEAAAQALAQYKNNPEVFKRLDDFAKAPGQRETVRIAVIKVLGTMYDKRAAQTLVDLSRGMDESSGIKNAATDALVDLTGLKENGRDVQRWQNWWAANQGKPEDQWRTELLRNRAARFDAIQKEHADLLQETRNFLAEQYQSAPEDKRSDVLLRILRSNQPEFRSIGAQLVYNDLDNNKPVPASVKERLRVMVGDSDTGVRQEVARTLFRMNDKEAFEALLTQFGQETDPDVKRALAGALGFIQNTKSVPQILTLLDDPSFATQTAGVNALRQLAPTIHAQDIELANRVADKLVATFELARDKPGGEALRAACVEAIAVLKDPRQLPFFYHQLQDADPAIRKACLVGLRELGKEESADQIANYLADPEPSVRMAAVQALETTATFAHAERLYGRLKPTEESESSIRDAAWRVLSTLFDSNSAPKDQLPGWADRFKNEPARRVAVQKALAKKLLADKDLEQLAVTRQNIGETLMKMDPPDSAEAATYFGMALDYWRERNTESMVTENLVRQRIEALLKSRQYPEAAQFAAQMIEWSPVHQQTMGSQIRNEAERLRDTSDLKNCAALINEALKMRPPLAENYVDRLKIIKDDLDRQPKGN